MSASVLREAAALMRERGEAATRTEMPWDVDEIGAVWAQENDGQPVLIATRATDADAAHIASWHPAVALAVADWLDDHAETAEMFVAKEIPASAWSMNWQTSHNRALAVATAYLGTP